jgi:hypothetical protein
VCGEERILSRYGGPTVVKKYTFLNTGTSFVTDSKSATKRDKQIGWGKKNIYNFLIEFQQISMKPSEQLITSAAVWYTPCGYNHCQYRLILIFHSIPFAPQGREK